MSYDRIIDPCRQREFQITDARRPTFKGQIIESLSRQVEHQAMRRITEISDGITAQIIHGRHAGLEIRRTDEPTIEVQIVIVARAQLQSDEVSVFPGDAVRFPGVRLVTLQLGDSESGLLERPCNQRRRTPQMEGVAKSLPKCTPFSHPDL